MFNRPNSCKYFRDTGIGRRKTDMRMRVGVVPILFVILTGCSTFNTESSGWQSLFNGEDLTGWRASETPGCFSVENGVLVVKGGRSHLFYEGPVYSGDFKDFEFSAEVMTTPGSNSGIYFHTAYQETGWPVKGHECQVNVSHSDERKGGSLYAVEDVYEKHARDGEWYTQEIIVRGKRVITKMNGKVLVDYVEPDELVSNDEIRTEYPGRMVSHGTFAIQAHDPDSIVYYRNINVRPLP
jgi:hypothetical protein